jgi:hypothetical protein
MRNRYRPGDPATGANLKLSRHVGVISRLRRTTAGPQAARGAAPFLRTLIIDPWRGSGNADGSA